MCDVIKISRRVARRVKAKVLLLILSLSGNNRGMYRQTVLCGRALHTKSYATASITNYNSTNNSSTIYKCNYRTHTKHYSTSSLISMLSLATKAKATLSLVISALIRSFSSAPNENLDRARGVVLQWRVLIVGVPGDNDIVSSLLTRVSTVSLSIPIVGVDVI